MSTSASQITSVFFCRWPDGFSYVNCGLFSGSVAVPRFSRIARSYLLHIGGLDWTQINPDIFGSMIQAVADDEERGALGMHYTSVPNILKVLNPLFLDDLRDKLEEAGDNAWKLLNLWCEHALTVSYRFSLTEIVQIIGRATRDAPARRRRVPLT